MYAFHLVTGEKSGAASVDDSAALYELSRVTSVNVIHSLILRPL